MHPAFSLCLFFCGKVSCGHGTCRWSRSPHTRQLAAIPGLATERRRLVVNFGCVRYGSCPWAELCVCDAPTLTVAPSVWEESAQSASWLQEGGPWVADVLLRPGHVRQCHCWDWWLGELLGCLSRANNAVSVEGCVTVNNV